MRQAESSPGGVCCYFSEEKHECFSVLMSVEEMSVKEIWAIFHSGTGLCELNV